MTLQSICDLIILVGAVILAIERIYNYSKKPVDKVKKSTDEHIIKIVHSECDEILPTELDEHANLLRSERQKEHEKLLTQLENLILDKITPHFEEIERINKEQNEDIKLLKKSNLDMLRQNILYLYDHHKKEKKLTITEKEYLDELYNDYSAEGGNSYIHKIYKRMQDWEIIDEDEKEE